jgi:hypothetical protein
VAIKQTPAVRVLMDVESRLGSLASLSFTDESGSWPQTTTSQVLFPKSCLSPVRLPLPMDAAASELRT